MNKTIIQSYVPHGDKWFFVSTINRESSAALAYGNTYAETMVWEFDFVTKERGRIVWQAEEKANSLVGHYKVCERLYETGICEVDDDL